MAFLNKIKMAKRVAAIGVGEHPLLKEEELAESEKTAYVEGLVFAALSDDEKVDDGEQLQIRRLAASLKVDKAELKTCFETVLGLKTDEEKLSFAEEIAGVLRRGLIPAFFVADVEALIDKEGTVLEGAADILDYLGTLLFETREWRRSFLRQKKALEDKQANQAAERVAELANTLKDLVAPLLSKAAVSCESLGALRTFWSEVDFADLDDRTIWQWIKNVRIVEIRGFNDNNDRREKRKRCERFWFLMALIMRTYEADSINMETVNAILKHTRTNKTRATRYKAELLELANAYLGEEVTGE